VDVKPAATQVAAVVKAPEMVAELRRIGILAVVVLATLIILALVLG
jgi:F0F1-type ATP synthase membrane subunit c/vacuolar-type H+-ATPase subunit K